MIAGAAQPGRTGRAVLVIAIITLAAVTAAPRPPARQPRLPALMLWAWERPTDLRDLPGGAGVAFLSQTITLTASSFDVQPRRQRLLVSPSTPLIAVTRIETKSSVAPNLDDAQLARVAEAIAATGRLPRVRGLQIDFDATRSERPLYRRVLDAVRGRTGPGMFLSVTALASWCLSDGWLDGLPVDEVVPMLFRLGPGERIPGHLMQPACAGSLGLALDEPLPPSMAAPRTYVFNAQPWSAASIAEASRRAAR
jgi:hypothetical protein